MATINPNLKYAAAASLGKATALGQKYDIKTGYLQQIQEIYFPNHNLILTSTGTAIFHHEPRNKENKLKHIFVATPINNILVPQSTVLEIMALADLQSQSKAGVNNLQSLIEKQAAKVGGLTKRFFS